MSNRCPTRTRFFRGRRRRRRAPSSRTSAQRSRRNRGTNAPLATTRNPSLAAARSSSLSLYRTHDRLRAEQAADLLHELTNEKRLARDFVELNRLDTELV